MAAVLYGHPCPVCACSMEAAVGHPTAPVQSFQCPNCGDHSITEEALEDMAGYIRDSNRLRTRLAFGVRKVRPETLLTSALIGDILGQTELPPALERIDNLVMHLAATLNPGQSKDLVTSHLRAVVGAETDGEAKWVIDEALQLRYVVGQGPWQEGGAWKLNDASLARQGWERHAALMRDGAGSRHAFVAMAFVPEMWDLLGAHLGPAVAQTGFDLRALAGPHQQAGSIDNRMRVEIRTSRFMVCDLTHANCGAYWEAGFAEGLGRPVFYTCRKDVLASKEKGVAPHFDTAHQLIIPWAHDTIKDDMQALKAVIRATLPAEARMEDR